MRIFVLLVLAAALAPHAWAEKSGLNIWRTAPDSTGSLRIESEPPGADVMLDTVYVGPAPLEQHGLREGTYRVRIIAPSLDAWPAAVWRDTVTLRGGEILTVRPALMPPLLVDSRPQGAFVSVGDTVLGTTPLRLVRAGTPATVHLSKEGFDSVDVSIRNLLSMPVVSLRPRNGLEILSPREERPEWLLYGSGTVMVLSGIVTAVLKDRANRSFDDYLRTGNPASLRTTRRYDRVSTASLIVTQLAFCALSYTLLSDP